VTTQYSVTVTVGGGCSATSNAVMVNVALPAPAWVNATTQQNRDVVVSWASVPGAIAYQIERTSPFGTDVRATDTTAWNDTVPASEFPVTYVYTVFAIDEGFGVSPGRSDYATAATLLHQQVQLIAGETSIRGADLAELRRGVDAFRASYGFAPAFAGAYEPVGVVAASHFTALVAALNETRSAIGLPQFVYAGVPAPEPGGTVLAAHVQQLREALR